MTLIAAVQLAHDLRILVCRAVRIGFDQHSFRRASSRGLTFKL
jgi:hypothetical protein